MKYLLILDTNCTNPVRKQYLLYDDEPSPDEALCACLEFIEAYAERNSILQAILERAEISKQDDYGWVRFTLTKTTTSFWWSVHELKTTQKRKLEELLTSQIPGIRKIAKEQFDA